MGSIELAEIESRFVELVWQNEPLPSGELVTLCEKKLNRKQIDEIQRLIDEYQE